MGRNTYAYFVVEGPHVSPSIAQFRVTTGGTLTPLSPPTIAVSNTIVSFTASPDGNYLYMLEEGSTVGTFLRFSINNDGTLAANPVTSAGPSVAYPFTLSSDGRFAFVPFGNSVATYSINSSGQFNSTSTVLAGSDAMYRSD
jgi:6-phosphogluconolactonase (cycloisomerase 2 family)